MPGREWSGRDDQDLRRWFSAGQSFKTIGNSFSPARSVREVIDRLQFLGFLGGSALLDRLPPDALTKAKAALAEQIAAAKREMKAAEGPKNPNKL
jgi:hypothetical protein